MPDDARATPTPHPSAQGGAVAPSRYWPVVALPALLLVIAWPIILSGNLAGRGAYDQIHFHEPAIRVFAQQLPSPDLSDYLSATTPGYHLVLAFNCRIGMCGRVSLQLAGSVFSLLLVALLTWACVRRTSPWRATVLVLPVLASFYVLFPAIWLLPDNAGWLGVLAVLLIALRPKFDGWTLLAGGVALAGLVFFRQIHIWTGAVLWAAAWLGSGARTASMDPDDDLSALFGSPASSIWRTVQMMVATLPGFALLAWCWWMWGALVPPSFQDQYDGTSPAAFAFFLSLLGGLSLLFGPWWIPALTEAWRQRPLAPVLVAVGGLALALAGPTTFSVEDGRFSGLWNVVRVLDERGITIAGYASPLILGFGTLGALALYGWARALGLRERWIVLASVFAFVAAQSASPLLWQRYSEPLILMLLALMASMVDRRQTDSGATPHPLAMLGPTMLAGLLAVVTAQKLLTQAPVPPTDASAGAMITAHPPAAARAPGSAVSPDRSYPEPGSGRKSAEMVRQPWPSILPEQGDAPRNPSPAASLAASGAQEQLR